MPKGALFHLHCLTRGEKEQVFHIENGVCQKTWFLIN